MARNKTLDDLLFNCSQKWEIDQVANHYGAKSTAVKEFLIDCCKNNSIKNFTHHQVYQLIHLRLGLPIPV